MVRKSLVMELLDDLAGHPAEGTTNNRGDSDDNNTSSSNITLEPVHVRPRVHQGVAVPVNETFKTAGIPAVPFGMSATTDPTNASTYAAGIAPVGIPAAA